MPAFVPLMAGAVRSAGFRLAKAGLQQARRRAGFQPADEGNFLVALLGVSRDGRNWKVPCTRRLESPRYVAELDEALLP